MILVIHIISALVGLLLATLAWLHPSHIRIATATGFTLLTLASGAMLVAQTHSPLAPSCLSGMVYLAITASELLFAYRRLATNQ